LVGQDFILQAGFSTGLLLLSSASEGPCSADHVQTTHITPAELKAYSNPTIDSAIAAVIIGVELEFICLKDKSPSTVSIRKKVSAR
jgi:hypothetical protein